MRITRVAAVGLLSAAIVAFAQLNAGIWVDVPFVHQPPEGCGAASIAMVMQYWAAQLKMQAGQDSDVAAIQRALYSPKAHGIQASAMQQYLEAHGFRVFAINGSWNDLEEQLRKGRPLIAAIRPPDQRQLSDHYGVVADLRY